MHNTVSAQTADTGSDAAEKIGAASPALAEGSVPRFIRFSATLRDAKAEPLHGVAGLEFAIYKEREGGSPVWTEIQNVELDERGHYTALIGVTTNEGISPDLLGAGELRWLSVRAVGGEEQPRMLLVSVPYALKASDADTLGGKPASAYLLSSDRASSSTEATSGNPATTVLGAPHAMVDSKNATPSDSPNASLKGAGTTNYIPIWTDSRTLGNAIIFQTGGNVGVGTITPGATLDSVGAGIAVRGTSAGTNGNGLFGNASATSGYANGVYGQTANAGNGVFGVNNSPTGGVGVNGTSNATSGGTGVYGQSASPDAAGVTGNAIVTSGGTGVFGISQATSGGGAGVVGTSVSTNGAGVVGNANATSGFAVGVNGQTFSPDGFGGNFVNNFGGTGVVRVARGTSVSPTGGFFQSESNTGIGAFGNATATSGNTTGVIGQVFSPNGTAGLFQNVSGQGLILLGHSGSNFTTVFSVDAAGNLDISGNLTAAGSKSARVKTQDGREVALYAVESPENWFEDFGTAHLQGGVAQVALDSGFLQTVDTAAGYRVFLTPNGDCHGLYVAAKTAASFEVHELSGGNTNIAFDYRIVARRLGFENVRLQAVHPPQTSPEMKVRLASPRAVRQVTAPLPKPPAKITIPSLPPS